MKNVRAFIDAGKRAVRQLAHKHYCTAKAYHSLCLRFSSSHSKEPLIIYQMGKVGSTTIVKSLEAAGLDMPIYHVHVLTPASVDRVEQTYKKHFCRMSFVPRHLWESQYLCKQIDRGPRAKRWQVVTLLRDPIARNISAFFQNLDVKFLDSGRRCRIRSRYDFEITIKTEDTEDLVNLFLETFDHNAPLTWFDSQLKPVFGIDVFSSGFPQAKGYKVYEGEYADVLVLKLESLDKCASDAFKEFLNVESFTLVRANVSREKEYYVLYRKFLDSATLPDSYIDTTYASRYTQHFYSEEEINRFKARWCRNMV